MTVTTEFGPEVQLSNGVYARAQKEMVKKRL